MSTVGMVLRLAISMAVVIGLMWLAARGLRNRGAGLAGRPGRSQPIELLARRGLTKGASVAVVRAGGRTLLLGVTDAQITLLGESDDLVPAPGPGGPAPGDLGGPGPAGTSLRSTLESLRERTVRRV